MPVTVHRADLARPVVADRHRAEGAAMIEHDLADVRSRVWSRRAVGSWRHERCASPPRASDGSELEHRMLAAPVTRDEGQRSFEEPRPQLAGRPVAEDMAERRVADRRVVLAQRTDTPFGESVAADEVTVAEA